MNEWMQLSSMFVIISLVRLSVVWKQMLFCTWQDKKNDPYNLLDRYPERLPGQNRAQLCSITPIIVETSCGIPSHLSRDQLHCSGSGNKGWTNLYFIMYKNVLQTRTDFTWIFYLCSTSLRKSSMALWKSKYSLVKVKFCTSVISE